MKMQDRRQLGLLITQDHRPNVPASIRLGLAGVRVTDGGDGSYFGHTMAEVDGYHTATDIHPWRVWQTHQDEGSRGFGLQAQAFAAVVTGSDEDVNPNVTGGEGDAWTIAAKPIQLDDYLEDERVVEVSHAQPEGMPPWPEGTLAIALAGTREDGQEDLLLHADPRIPVPHHKGPGEMSAIGVDLDPDGTLSPEWQARVSTMWRVARPKTYTHLDVDMPREGHNLLAFNLAPTGNEGWPGYGPMIGELAMPRAITPTRRPDETPSRPPPDTTGRSSGAPAPPAAPAQNGAGGDGGSGNGFAAPSGSVTPGRGGDFSPGGAGGDASAGGGGVEGRGGKKAGTRSYTYEQKGPAESKLGIAFLDHKAAGPIIIGAGETDKHVHGTTRSPESQTMHPAHFSIYALWLDPDDRERDAPFKFEGDLVGGNPQAITVPVHLRYNRFGFHPFMGQTRNGLFEWETTVPYFGSTPPPDTPITPEPPPPPPPDIPTPTPRLPRVPPTTPGVPVEPDPTPDTPTTPGAPPSTIELPDGTIVPFNPFDPEHRRRWRRGGWKGGGGGHVPFGGDVLAATDHSNHAATASMIMNPQTQGFAEHVWRPQGVTGRRIDMLGPNASAAHLYADDEVRPSVGRVFAVAAESAGEFLYTKSPGFAETRGGYARGVVVYAPPEVGPRDQGVGYAPDVAMTETHHGFLPGVWRAYGYPGVDSEGEPTGGMAACSFREGVEPSDGSYRLQGTLDGDAWLDMMSIPATKDQIVSTVPVYSDAFVVTGSDPHGVLFADPDVGGVRLAGSSFQTDPPVADANVTLRGTSILLNTDTLAVVQDMAGTLDPASEYTLKLGAQVTLADGRVARAILPDAVVPIANKDSGTNVNDVDLTVAPQSIVLVLATADYLAGSSWGYTALISNQGSNSVNITLEVWANGVLIDTLPTTLSASSTTVVRSQPLPIPYLSIGQPLELMAYADDVSGNRNPQILGATTTTELHVQQ